MCLFYLHINHLTHPQILQRPSSSTKHTLSSFSFEQYILSPTTIRFAHEWGLNSPSKQETLYVVYSRRDAHLALKKGGLNWLLAQSTWQNHQHKLTQETWVLPIRWQPRHGNPPLQLSNYHTRTVQSDAHRRLRGTPSTLPAQFLASMFIPFMRLNVFCIKTLAKFLSSFERNEIFCCSYIICWVGYHRIIVPSFDQLGAPLNTAVQSLPTRQEKGINMFRLAILRNLLVLGGECGAWNTVSVHMTV